MARGTETGRKTQEHIVTNRIWLQSYPAGMPAEIDPDAYGSIADMFEKTAAKFADRPRTTISAARSRTP